MEQQQQQEVESEERLGRVPKRPLLWRPHQQQEGGDGTSGATTTTTTTASVSIVGLGCSSFSTFFMNDDDDDNNKALLQLDTMKRCHPVVQNWIETIRYAICEAGITLLDTAPWYGHGTSERVVGWALQDILQRQQSEETDDTTSILVQRSDLIVNTKVGRYQANPTQQFDFSYEATLASTKRSLERLQLSYIDVLQLHDPEFAPTLDVLLNECIPALLDCKQKGYCRRLGMTGYPLNVQHQLLQATLEKYQKNIWDQALTYSHFNLHDSSLLYAHHYLAPTAFSPGGEQEATTSDNDDNDRTKISYWEYCHSLSITCLAAAPLSMGLLTPQGPPAWHPAPNALKEACRAAAQICQKQRKQQQYTSADDDADADGTVVDNTVDIAQLALLFALTEPKLPCTIVGMKNVEEVKTVQAIAMRVKTGMEKRMRIMMNQQQQQQQEQALLIEEILTPTEKQAMDSLLDKQDGPFAQVWKTGEFEWDGVQESKQFWMQLKEHLDSSSSTTTTKVEQWQAV